MKDIMLKIALGTAIVLFIVFLAWLYTAPTAIEGPFEYPEVKSVVIEDGRTVCEKKSELVLVREWERLCEKQGNERHCSLDKQTAGQARLYQQLSLERCEKQGV